MTDAPHTDGDNPLPLQPANELLIKALEHTLTQTERKALHDAASVSPELSAELKVAGLLLQLRHEDRMTSSEEAAWQQFRKWAEAYRSGVVRKGWLQRLEEVFFRDRETGVHSVFRPWVPAMAVLVIVVQSGLLTWLAVRPAQETQYRGGTIEVPLCSTVWVRFKPEVTESQIRRVLMQGEVTIVAGPDAMGGYRLSGTTDFLQNPEALLDDIATQVRGGEACPKK